MPTNQIYFSLLYPKAEAALRLPLHWIQQEKVKMTEQRMILFYHSYTTVCVCVGKFEL